MSFQTIEEVKVYLEKMPMFAVSGAVAARFGLDGILALCDAIGNPQQGLRCIHVAGTNGKGSVCQLLHAIYSKAGYRTGLYTSPHLERVTQRFVVNGEEMPDASLLRFFREHGSAVQQLQPTFFELTTAIAFWHFRQQQTELAVIETGLGGRLDATNVVTPLVSVITSIGYDHMDVLGSSLAEIAAEKAGIIKHGVPVVTGRLPDEAAHVIRQHAKLCSASLFDAATPEPVWDEGRITLMQHSQAKQLLTGFRQPVQRFNVAMAAQVTALLQPLLPVSEADQAGALQEVSALGAFAGRFEQFVSGSDIYYDGAHNPEAFSETLALARKTAAGRKMILVFTLMRDKLTPEMCRLISEFDELFYFEANLERAATFTEIHQQLPKVQPFNAANWPDLKKAVLKPDAILLFSGSLYFYRFAKSLFSGANTDAELFAGTA
ncbi:MAG: hypothetical protein JJU35_03955 [Balneolales bacterium]|nr:hypothetical protein [Balneolales bacterium]